MGERQAGRERRVGEIERRISREGRSGVDRQVMGERQWEGGREVQR